MSNTAAGRVSATWHSSVTAAPPDTRTAAHPSRTRAWAAAWQQVTTEQVQAHRHLHLSDGTVGETVSWYLVPGQGSPCWSLLETSAAVPPIWPGPVLYAGSPHAQYGGAGTATPEHAAATTAAGLRLATELGASAVVYPGLDADQAALLASSAEGGGKVLDLGIAAAFTRPLGAGPDQWWTGIPQRYRNDARRTWRRGTEAGLTLTPLTGARMHPHLAAFERLANTTAGKHGTRLYGLDMLHHLATVPGAVLLAAHCEQQLVAGVYGWLHNRCLYLWAAGIDYAHPAARHTYKWLLSEAALWAIHEGADRVDLGRSNCAAKLRLGCQPQVLRTVVHLPHPAPETAGALTGLARRLGEQALPHLPAGTIW